jgi:hypothetical protein
LSVAELEKLGSLLLMTLNLRKALFSIAYSNAVAAVAGVNVGQWEEDDDSVDITLRRKGGCAPTLDLQLKCTAAEIAPGDTIPFTLSMKNYDDLRRPVQGARWLTVMFVPTDPADWITIECPNQIVMQKCAWWMSLVDLPDVAGQQTVTVHLPKANVFSPAAVTRQLDEMETMFQANIITA